MVVLQACGLGFKELLIKVLGIAVLVSVLVGFLTLYVDPKVQRLNNKVLVEIAQQSVISHIVPQSFTSLSRQQTFYTSTVSRDRKRLSDVFLAEHLNNGDWRMAWFWIGISVWIIALPLTLLLLINKPEDIKELPDGITKTSKINSKTNTEEQWTLQDAVKKPTLWLLALAGGLVFFIHTGVNIHQAAFLRDSGISASAAASALAIMAGGSAIGSIIWGNLLDKFSVKLVYSIAAGWLGITALLFLQVNSTTSAFIVAIITFLSFVIIGVFPLIPFLFRLKNPFFLSSVILSLLLFLLQVLKIYFLVLIFRSVHRNRNHWKFFDHLD